MRKPGGVEGGTVPGLIWQAGPAILRGGKYKCRLSQSVPSVSHAGWGYSVGASDVLSMRRKDPKLLG